VIARSGKLLEVGLKLADGDGRARDVGSDSPDVSGSVVVRLVPRTAGFKAIEDLLGEAPAGARFAQH
jgi:hypothetical protein